MRTFGVLVAGWVGGGVMVMLLALPAVTKAVEPKAVERRPLRSAAGAAAAPQGTTVLRVPVAGFNVADLNDNFLQPRGGGRTHHALDILAPRGTPVVAAVDGTIRKLFNSGAGGITIYQFDVAEERVYYYAHLDRYADDVAEGLFVKQGTVIGYVGISGNAPVNTPHLHFAIEQLTPEKVWWKGTPLNPYTLLTTSASVQP
jgi:murein DD-endopeptidase MepM/ murein hydrolase activator NlpD